MNIYRIRYKYINYDLRKRYRTKCANKKCNRSILYDKTFNSDKLCPKCRNITNSKSGYLGVRKTSGQYHDARIILNGTEVYLGSFISAFQAAIARDLFVVEFELPYPLNFNINYVNEYDNYRKTGNLYIRDSKGEQYETN